MVGGITALYLCAAQHQSGNNESGVCIIETFYTWAGGLTLLFNTQQTILKHYIHIFLLSKNNFHYFVYAFSSTWHILLICAFLQAQCRGILAEGLCNRDRKERELLICGKFWHFETNNYCRAWWMVTLVKFSANLFVRSLGSVPSRHVFSIMSNHFSLVLLNQNEQSPRESCRPFN